jgi:hypothetical protein
MKNRIPFYGSVVALAFFFVFCQPAVAQSETADDGWDHSLAVYLWGSSVSGTTATGTGVDLDFDTLFDNLEFAFMGSYQGRKGRWVMFADVIYIDLAAEQQINLVPPVGPGAGVNAGIDIGLTSWVVNAAGGYNVYDDREGTTTDLIFGARYLDLDTSLMLNLSVGIPELDRTVSSSKSGGVIDAIVGARGVISLGDRWFAPWGANIGAGDSDLTWQAMAGIGFKAASWADIALTYRYLKWDLDKEGIADLAFSGPLLGVVFRF